VTRLRESLAPDDVYDLAAELQNERFEFGADQLVAAVDLCVALGIEQRGGQPRTVYATLLAPIFVRSEAEQHRFYTVYARWEREAKRQRIPETFPIPALRPRPQPANVSLRPIRRGRLVAAGLLLSAAIFGGFLTFHDEDTPSPADAGPDAGLDSGRARHDGAPDPRPSPITRTAARPDGGQSGRTKTAVLPKTGTPDAGSSPEKPVPQIQDAATWPWKHSLWHTLALSPILAQLLWFWWRLRWRQVWLNQKQTSAGLDTTQVHLAPSGEGVIASVELRRLVADMRARVRRSSQEIDVEATVALMDGRPVQPIHAVLGSEPGYLVLIDQHDYRDQLARHADALVLQLRSEGVAVEVRHFCRDPRISYSPPPVLRGIPLDELVGREGERRLILIGDGAAFFDDEGAPKSWMRDLLEFADPSFLSTRMRSGWGEREQSLHRAGFLVAPFDSRGLQALGAFFRHRAEPDPDRMPAPLLVPAPAPAFPPDLRRNQERWLQSRPPAGLDLVNLQRELRLFLGEDGFVLLAASAVYPRLDHALSVYLDQRLHTAGGERASRPDRLLRLVRLPWFRHGSLPLYLRIALVSELSAIQLARIKAALGVLLSGVALQGREGAGGITLEVATRTSAFQRLLRAMTRTAPADSALRDVVLAEVMSRRSAGRLPLAAPAALHRRLRLARWQDYLRPAVALLLASALWRTPFPEHLTSQADQRTMAYDESLLLADGAVTAPGSSWRERDLRFGMFRFGHVWDVGKLDVQLAGVQLPSVEVNEDASASLAMALVYPSVEPDGPEPKFEISNVIARTMDLLPPKTDPALFVYKSPAFPPTAVKTRAVLWSWPQIQNLSTSVAAESKEALDAAIAKLSATVVPFRLVIFLEDALQPAAIVRSEGLGSIAKDRLARVSANNITVVNVGETTRVVTPASPYLVRETFRSDASAPASPVVRRVRFKLPWWATIGAWPAEVTTSLTWRGQEARRLIPAGHVGALEDRSKAIAAVSAALILLLFGVSACMRWPVLGVWLFALWLFVDLPQPHERVAQLATDAHPDRDADSTDARPNGDDLTAAKVVPSHVGELMLKAALGEIGAAEEPPGSNQGPRLTKYFNAVGLKPGVPWSGAFVSWVILQSGRSELPRAASIHALVLGYSNLGLYTPASESHPVPGDLFLIQYENGGGHGGVVVKTNPDGTFATVEGNAFPGNDAGGPGGFAKDAGVVASRRRSLKDISGIVHIPDDSSYGQMPVVTGKPVPDPTSGLSIALSNYATCANAQNHYASLSNKIRQAGENGGLMGLVRGTNAGKPYWVVAYGDGGFDERRAKETMDRLRKLPAFEKDLYSFHAANILPDPNCPPPQPLR
jgi:hypothetical protein